MTDFDDDLIMARRQSDPEYDLRWQLDNLQKKIHEALGEGDNSRTVVAQVKAWMVTVTSVIGQLQALGVEDVPTLEEVVAWPPAESPQR